MDAGLSSSLAEFLEENKCMNNKYVTLIIFSFLFTKYMFFRKLAIHICVKIFLDY